MLRTPKFRGLGDPITMAIAGLGEPIKPEVVVDGVVVIPSFNFDILVFGRNKFFEFEPEFPSYGVCDSPEQFLEKYGDILSGDPRTFAVGLTHVAKNPGEKCGWRWHKWGEYVGTGNPRHEYLADEDGFEDGVYCWNVVELSDEDC